MAKEKIISDKYKKIFWAVFSPLLAMLTVWALLRQNKNVSFRDRMHTAAVADKFWLISAAVSAALYIVFEAFALCSILKGTGFRATFRNGLLYSTSDIYFSAITPSATGGQPACAYFMMRERISGGVITAVLMLNIMMYTMSLVTLGLISVIISPGSFAGFSFPSRLLIVGGGCVQLILSVFFVFILKNGSFIFRFLKKVISFLGRKRIVRNTKKPIAKLTKAQADYCACSQLFSGNYRILLKAFFWNLLQRLSQILVSPLLFLAIGGNAALSVDVFAKQCLITIGYNFVPLPGAMGVADYLMLDGFSGIMCRDTAFHLEMLSRGMTFYICVSISGLVTLIGYIIKRRRRNEFV